MTGSCNCLVTSVRLQPTVRLQLEQNTAVYAPITVEEIVIVMIMMGILRYFLHSITLHTALYHMFYALPKRSTTRETFDTLFSRLIIHDVMAFFGSRRCPLIPGKEQIQTCMIRYPNTCV